jgi:hypothetical protein
MPTGLIDIVLDQNKRARGCWIDIDFVTWIGRRALVQAARPHWRVIMRGERIPDARVRASGSARALQWRLPSLDADRCGSVAQPR